MASVKLEDCSQTLELNVNIKDEEVEEKIRTTVSHDRLRLSLRPVTSTVRTNPACHSPSTLSRNLQSLGPDCDSGAQFALQDPEMASVKLEDCSQTLELNVIIKDEEEEEKIRTTVSHELHDRIVSAQIWRQVPKHFCSIKGPKNTEASIILQWKKFGTTKTLPRAGHPAKLSKWGRRALVREVAKNPMVLLCQSSRVPLWR
ncbi:uncharacterized protein LOC135567429 isoform X2 [Oncorhynchus nerka]|uniref:uncharacterized protein LOC135567429 isoform X2 n=1 Tax=Oncorhynchus nerka TaxID=8023 RepID=UPI0031B89244